MQSTSRCSVWLSLILVLLSLPCHGVDRLGGQPLVKHHSEKRQKVKLPPDAVLEAGCRYELSICAVFQQEGRFLKEWIEFHKLVGIEHFYLFNNDSTDNYLEVLQPYIEAGEVDLIDWPSPPNEDKTHCQFQYDVYRYCAHQLAYGQTRWLAIIDIDEFLLPLQHASVIDFLREHEDYGTVLLHWRYFGTSYIERIPDDKLMIECLVRCYLPVHIATEDTRKSIIKPHRTPIVNIHVSKSPYGTYLANPGHDPSWYQGRKIPSVIPEMRINHYVSRDVEFIREVKRPRREKLHNTKWSEETLQRFIEAYNEIENTDIFPWVAALRLRLFGESIGVR